MLQYNDKIVVITDHAIARSKERKGLPEKRARRNFEIAVRNGSRAEDCPVHVREYISKKTRDGSYAVYYDNYCYIVQENDCYITGITLFPVPVMINEKPCYFGKNKIKGRKMNAKKYSKYHN